MKYVNAISGSIFAFLVLLVAIFALPDGKDSEQVKLILTISTFLFAILSGFFMSRLNKRFDNMRDLIAAEDAHWLLFYKLSQFFGKTFSEKIKQLIDTYYIIWFDSESKKYTHNAKVFLSAFDEVRNLKKIEGEKALQVFDDMVGLLSKIEENRNHASVVVSEKLTRGQWMILILLVGVLLLSIFYLNPTIILLKLTVTLLATVLILILLILRDLQNLRLGGQILTVESGEQVLEAMGKLRYYPHRELETGATKIPKNITTYRVGYHNPGEPFDIRVEKRS